MNPRPAIAAIGTFDGLHRGHMEVIRILRETSAIVGLRPLVFTFHPHPLAVVAPERTPPMLMEVAEREQRLRQAGVEPILVTFDQSLRSLTAADWLQRLRDDYGVTHVVLGYDNTFGSDGRHMTRTALKDIAASLHITPIEAPELPGLSSSRARRAILAGDVDGAAAILGRPYTLSGEIVCGQQLGRTLGFPTANLRPVQGLAIPGNGVYAAVATLPDGCRLPAMVNIGVRPTLGDGHAPTIEANLIGFSGDLYGATLTLGFTARIRNERRFYSLEDLKAQLTLDRRQTLALIP